MLQDIVQTQITKKEKILIFLIWSVLISAHPFVFNSILGVNYMILLMPSVLALLIYSLLINNF